MLQVRPDPDTTRALTALSSTPAGSYWSQEPWVFCYCPVRLLMSRRRLSASIVQRAVASQIYFYKLMYDNASARTKNTRMSPKISVEFIPPVDTY